MEAHEGKVLHCPPPGNSSFNLPPRENHLSVNQLGMHGSTNNIQSPNLAFNSNIYSTSLSNSLAHVPFHLQLCDKKPVISCEKKLRRMISNRESARRAQIRRKKQIEELQSRVNQLQTVNNHLAEKVISLSESNQHILQENSLLHDTISSLQMAIAELLA